jgi:hypothetical protein
MRAAAAVSAGEPEEYVPPQGDDEGWKADYDTMPAT